MRTRGLSGFCVAAMAAFTLACNNSPAAPAPLAGLTAAAADVPNGTGTLKVTAPTVISPAGGVEIDDDDPELVIGNSADEQGQQTNLSYVFEVRQGSDLVYRSAPVPAGSDGKTSHETTVALPSGQPYTWAAYAVYLGLRGPTSEPAAFTTGIPDRASCAALTTEIAVVQCRRAQYAVLTQQQKIVFMRDVARDLNRSGFADRPYGLLHKSSGNTCEGYACDIVCAGQGTGQRQWDILRDEEGGNVATWHPVGAPIVRLCEIVE